jgi:hypothetical protein
MNICVAAWYYHKSLMQTLQNCYPVCWVCHRPPPAAEIDLFDHSFNNIPNVGLEFGCYDWYLKNRWNGGSVLFTHDDNEITEEALDQIALIPHDQCFLFPSLEVAEANGKAHGRAFFCSEKLLRRLKGDGGFWYNEAPETSVAIPATSAEAPNYHNAGILTFLAWLKSLPAEFTANQVAVVPGLKTGYRGRL